MKKMSHLKEDCLLLVRAAFWVSIFVFIAVMAQAQSPDSGYENKSANGYVGAANAGDDLWPLDGAYGGFVSTSSTVHVFSTSAADAAAGTGCRTILVTGLDSSYNVQSETITTNGASVVDSANQYLRLNEAKCVTVGSGGVNAGVIQLYITGSSLGSIPTGEGKTQQAIYTAPLDRKTYLKGFNVSVGNGSLAHASVNLEMREAGKSWTTVDFAQGSHDSGSSQKSYGPWMVVPKKADLRLRVSGVGTTGYRVHGGLELIEQR